VLRFAARCPTILWLLLLLLLAHRFALRFLSARAAPLVLILLALEPNLTAHGSLVTVDVPFAAVSLGLFLYLLEWQDRKTIFHAAIVGIWWGVAFGTKYSASLLLVPLGMVFLLEMLSARADKARLVTLLGNGIVLLGTTVLTLCACFGFNELGYSLNQ